MPISRLTATLCHPLSTLHDARCRTPCKTRFRPAGCAFAGRESNPLDRYERFQIILPPLQDFPGAIKLGLGDWRGTIDWPRAIFTDPLARSDFYCQRGLDAALTEFPADAFDEATTVAGIKRRPPRPIPAYRYEAEYQLGEEEQGFERTNAAHDRLQRFECRVREFIDRKMRAVLGEAWIKRRVSGEIRGEWMNKQKKAVDEGEPQRPLIAYADFTDYEKIMVRNDNWKDVFQRVFRRKTLVQESLRRLYPIRRCTMHARIITQDDQLYLCAETHRLLMAMGVQI